MLGEVAIAFVESLTKAALDGFLISDLECSVFWDSDQNRWAAGAEMSPMSLIGAYCYAKQPSAEGLAWPLEAVRRAIGVPFSCLQALRAGFANQPIDTEFLTTDVHASELHSAWSCSTRDIEEFFNLGLALRARFSPAAAEVPEDEAPATEVSRVNLSNVA